jgi:hypothetical protein
LHLIALIIDVHHPSSPRQRRRKACFAATPLRMKRQNQTRLLKTSYCFEHIRGQSGQACPRLVCMIGSRSFRTEARKPLFIRPGIIRICFLFTMSWNPQERACRLLAGITHSSETCFGRSRRIGDRPQLLGGARRDRTDDLMLAKHALSQLSYGPSRRKERPSHGPKGRKATRPPRPLARKARRPETKNGGPGKTRTSDLTLIKRAL